MSIAHIEDLYADHVAALAQGYGAALTKAGFDGVVIHSGTAVKRTVWDDQFWPVRPTPAFLHWVPLNDANCLFVFVVGKAPVLHWPEVKDFWERPAAPESRRFEQVLDVKRTATPDLPANRARIAWIGEDVARARELGFEGANVNPPLLVAALDAFRTKKTAYEIACVAEANRRAALGHDAVQKAFASGDHAELDLHLLYLRATRQDDPETPYKNIVALGRAASILHHIAYGRDASKAESLLVDAGAMCLGYCSDVTRTWVKSKNGAAATFAGLVSAMDAMQLRLCAKAAEGMPYEELHDESHRQVSALLVEAGVVKGSADEIDGRGVSRVFYPHGLGHSLGLQTHDVGCGLTTPKKENPFLRNTSMIAARQIFTIEPGLYFIDALLAELRDKPEGKLVDWDVVDALTPFGGIRIEDDVLVESGSIQNFTRAVLPNGSGDLGV